MQNIVYHGSNVEVPVPRVLQNGFYKDFGYGFYCTNLFKQAKRWAMTKKGNSVINRYKYVQDSGLKVLKFEEMTDEWLDFVVNCRRGIEHDYDIIDLELCGSLYRWKNSSKSILGNCKVQLSYAPDCVLHRRGIENIDI